MKKASGGSSGDDDDDALADTLLLQYGAYPDAKDIGIDYAEILSQATLAIDCRIDRAAPIPMDVLEHPSLGYLTRHGLRRHYTLARGMGLRRVLRRGCRQHR